jgi:hypothetical protein
MFQVSSLGFRFQRPMSLLAVTASVCGTAVLGGACTVNNVAAPATVDAGPGTSGADGGTDAPPGSASPLGFVPSNISLSGIDLSMAGDSDIATLCELSTEPEPTPGATCLTNAVEAIVTQSDGSKVHLYVVKSLKVEPGGRLTVNRPAGGLPLVIVSLGDMTILGSIDVHAEGDQAFGGGFQSTQNGQKGAGPGGGPAASGVGGTTKGAGAGGGSYCGKGGPGAVEAMSTTQAGAATASYGTPEIIPLVGGSSGGAGSFGAGAGGGAVQLVAGGQFSLGAGTYINVGGGGGAPAVSSNFGDNSSGGGSGGSILIEAKGVHIDGILAANGGGGGGVSAAGTNGTPDANPAPGGAKAGEGAGGAGGAATSLNGATPASVDPGPVGGGGGGVGRIRINSVIGSAVIAASAVLSPPAATACVTQGKVKQ